MTADDTERQAEKAEAPEGLSVRRAGKETRWGGEEKKGRCASDWIKRQFVAFWGRQGMPHSRLGQCGDKRELGYLRA